MDQRAHYEKALRHTAEANDTFLEMINHPTHPITNAELIELIKQNPRVWGRYRNYVGKLK